MIRLTVLNMHTFCNNRSGNLDKKPNMTIVWSKKLASADRYTILVYFCARLIKLKYRFGQN